MTNRIAWSLLVITVLILGSAPGVQAQTILQGFGAQTRGGAGGAIVHVTNLNDAGPGSLREAVSAGNRVVVFDVAGDIMVVNHLYVNGANITIDGFSAPPPGITLRGKGLILRGPKAHDVIVRGIRVRDASIDGIQVATGAYNIVIDHVSVHGSADGNIDITTSARDVTVSWSIVGGNGKNMLIKYRASRVSLHHNLLAESVTRSPQVRIDEDTTLKASETTADIRNNVIANWAHGYGTLVWYGPWVNVVNNVYAGSDDALSVDTARAFVAGNRGAGKADINRVGTELQAFTAPEVTTQDACGAAVAALAGAGVHPLDEIDRGIVTRVSMPGCSGPVARLDVSPLNLSFAGTAGGVDPVPAALSLSANVAGLRWTASVTTPWLALGSSSGTGLATVAVYARVAGLGEGRHTGSVVVESPDVPGSQQSIPVSLTLAPAEPGGGGEPVWFPVTAAADDGREYTTGVVRLGQKTLGAGKGSLLAFRFTGVSVPPGAVIHSAVVEFRAISSAGRPIDVRYLGEAAGDSAPLVQALGNLSVRAKTQAFVDDEPARWTAGAISDSAELRAIVQEIVSRADWASGHAMTLFMADHGSFGSRVLGAWEATGSTEQAAVLRIRYTVP